MSINYELSFKLRYSPLIIKHLHEFVSAFCLLGNSKLKNLVNANSKLSYQFKGLNTQLVFLTIVRKPHFCPYWFLY